MLQSVEESVNGRRGGGNGSGSGGGMNRSSTLVGRRLADAPSDLGGQVDREDSPLHSKRLSMCLTSGGGKHTMKKRTREVSDHTHPPTWLNVYCLSYHNASLQHTHFYCYKKLSLGWGFIFRAKDKNQFVVAFLLDIDLLVTSLI